MVRWFKDLTRVKAVGEAFRSLGVDGCLAFEELDKQLRVVKDLVDLCGVARTTYLITANSLVSYMLRFRGEEFWSLFREFTLKRCNSVNDFTEAVELVKEFTKAYNNLSLEFKLRRLDSLIKCRELFKPLEKGDLRSYVAQVARCLSSEPYSKTVVFSAKMSYYVFRVAGLKAYLEGVNIPVDRRVSLITLTSGMVNVGTQAYGVKELMNYVDVLMREPKLVVEVWNEVSKVSGIPPIVIDAPVWIVGGYLSFNMGREEIVKELINSGLGGRVDVNVLRRLIQELTYKT
ncbi:MAG: hypothetical protein B7O98_07840 [Zestosphaera tikiterensis]|uniref:N-glycosylase/DNA lyase n=1 Tax=Zestosphaera tikiterensis TaxID=1973259 RepID=A0A2R7Y593_9CREN|nr:MAG: hypothetical protein B7O98_07840 [Zestosphaera tikiterensis]